VVREFKLPYGRAEVTLSLPDSHSVAWIVPVEAAAAPDPAQLTRRALANPVGAARLADFADARSAVIAVADKTRPIPYAALYPLLDALADMGMTAITMLIASGAHAPMTPGEFEKIIPGDILRQYPVIAHDCDAPDLVYRGETSRGTPVCVNNTWASAGLRIVVGNIDPHQFMGFSGGVKSAAIGLAGRATIRHNHAMITDPRAALGRYDDNPARQDVEEIGRLIGVHFALGTILNREKHIVHVLAGEPVAVMRAGIPLVRELVEVPVSAPCDLVIASPGGHPKDIDLNQAQKALAHAARIAKPGGTVILVAACGEGAGGKSYEDWMAGMTSHAAVLERFAREEFRLGPHKAFLIARDAQRVRVVLVSEMPAEQVRRLLLTPAASLDAALTRALADLPPGARIGILPAATATAPVVTSARHVMA
jgi:nickel-dependent lactate racemase